MPLLRAGDAGWYSQTTSCLPTATVAIQLRSAILRLVYFDRFRRIDQVNAADPVQNLTIECHRRSEFIISRSYECNTRCCISNSTNQNKNFLAGRLLKLGVRSKG
jgi:hypothetical protein